MKPQHLLIPLVFVFLVHNNVGAQGEQIQFGDLSGGLVEAAELNKQLEKEITVTDQAGITAIAISFDLTYGKYKQELVKLSSSDAYLTGQMKKFIINAASKDMIYIDHIKYNSESGSKTVESGIAFKII
ncbi:MAG: hypothetical protein IH946_04185 [Bacteroidetes bacterium]|nr:hypothetical protein [Bacteroidota bacterium]